MADPESHKIWLTYLLSNWIPILALIATGIIAWGSWVAARISKESHELNKDLIVQQLKLEYLKDARIAWEHIANYAPWLWITLKPGKLREQINWGPIVKFDAVVNKSYSARIFGYKVNSIDLSESLENFQISRKSNGRPCKSLEGRLSNKPDLCSSLLDEAVEAVNRENDAAIDIIYKDMGSGILYKRKFYFTFDKSLDKLDENPRITTDAPRQWHEKQ